MWWLLNKLHPLMKTIRYGWKPVKILFLRSRNSRSRSLSLKHRNVFWHLTAISCQSVDCVSPHLHASVWPSLCWWDIDARKPAQKTLLHCPTCGQKLHRVSLMALGHMFDMLGKKAWPCFCFLLVKLNMQHYICCFTSSFIKWLLVSYIIELYGTALYFIDHEWNW